MTSSAGTPPRRRFEELVAAASRGQAARCRAAYDEQCVIRCELLAKAGRLAEEIEARLTPR